MTLLSSLCHSSQSNNFISWSIRGSFEPHHLKMIARVTFLDLELLYQLLNPGVGRVIRLGT